MKRVVILAFFAAASAFAQGTALKSVYVMPMAGGLDQYLAEWLTREHVVQVVADPKIAEAVLTDALGEGFEQKLLQMHSDEKSSEKADKDDKKETVAPHPAFRSGSAKGTVFLVDTKTHNVLWSDYQKAPRTRSPANLNREAERIAKKLHISFVR